MTARKNRAFELRLALLERGTTKSGTDGFAALGRRSAARSVAGGRWSQLSGNGSRGSALSSRHGSANSSSVSGTRRRPHRLPELGESGSTPSENSAPVKVTNINFGKQSNEPLPPITPEAKDQISYENHRNRRTQPSVPPLDVILEQEKRLREDLNNERCLTDPVQEVSCLQELGDLSIQKAYHEQDAVHIVNAAAIYNVALLKSSDDDQKIRIRSRLIEAERQLIQNSSKCSSVVIDKYLAMDTGARDNRKLSHIRQETRERIKKVEKRLELACLEAAAPNEETVQFFIHEMNEIGQSVQKTLIDLLSHMVTTCKAILGEPPCKYAILAVGPIATLRGNPFEMPLELILLIGNDTRPSNLDYFNNFFHYMHLKILNLGESPLSLAGVKLFSDGNNESILCFHDDTPLTGLYLDFLPRSTHISPLVTEEGGVFRRLTGGDDPLFMGSPWRIASLLRKDYIERLGYQTGCKLMNFLLIDGDRSLVDEYVREIEYILKEEDDGKDYRETYACDWITSILHSSEPIAIRNNGLSMIHLHPLESEIKLIHDLLNAIKVGNRITPEANPKQIVEKMIQKNLVSSDEGNNLLLCLSLAFYFEVKQKMLNSGSTKKKTNCSKSNGWSQTFCNHYTFTDWMVITYYQTLVPCWTCLYQRAQYTHSLSLEGCTLSNANFKVKALALYRLEEYNVAIGLLRDELGEVRSISDTSLVATLSHNIYNLIGLVSLVKGELNESRTSWNKAMEYKDIIADQHVKGRFFLEMWHNFGILQILKGKLDKALEQLSECVTMSQELFKDQPIGRDDFEAGIYENLGRTQAMLGMFRGAIKSYDISLRLRESAGLSYVNYEALRYINYKMGFLNLRMGKGEEALRCLFESLRYHVRLKSMNNHDIWDAMILREISCTYEMLGNLSLAAMYLFQVGKISRKVYRNIGLDNLNENHTSNDRSGGRPIEHILTLFELGNCLLHSKEYDLSKAVLDECEAHISRTNLKQIKCFLDVDLAQVQMLKGQIHLETGCMDNAEASLRASLDTFKRAYSEKSMPTYNTATCHKRLGQTLIQLGRYEEAIQHLDIAREYFNFTYGNNDVNSDMCEILNMNALVKRMNGQFVESHTDHKDSLSRTEALYGYEHVRVARCITEAGITYSMEGLYESAMMSFEQAMNIYRSVDLGWDKYLEEIPRLYAYRARCHISLGRIPQAERCWERAANKGRSIIQRHPNKLTAFVELLNEQANFFRHIDRPEEAIVIRKEVINRLRDAGKAENDAKILSVLFAIGKDLNASGNTEEAVKTISDAIDQKQRQSLDAEACLDLASWLSELSQVYAKAGEQEKSSECFLESLYLKKKHMKQGAVDDEVIHSLETIAGLHEKRGEFRQALALLKQSLAKSMQANREENKPQLISTIERLALAFQRLGEHSSALRYWQDALEIRDNAEKMENNGFQVLAEIHRRCGQCLDGLKSHERAIDQYRRSLNLLKKCEDYQGKDETLASTMGDIGKALNNLGRSQEALGHLTTASDSLKVQDKGQVSIEELASVLLHLGLAHENCGQSTEANECYLNALALKREERGSGDEEKIQILRALSRLHFTNGDFQDGIACLEEALSELQNSLRKDELSFEIASVLETMGKGYDQSGETGLSLKRTTEALQMFRKHFGHNRPCFQIARCLSSLGSICCKAGRREDTIAYAKQAIAMYLTILPENSDHPELVVLNTILGDCYSEMKDYQESVIHYKKATQICLYLHNGDAMHAEVLDVMGKLQDAQKKFGVST